MIKIWHNPRCKKSRETLQLLMDAGEQPIIIEYLKTVPAPSEIKEILSLLDIKAEDLLRKNESIFKEEYKGKSFSEEEWIKIMHDNPKLIERPVVIKGDQAVIGRPPENVKDLIA